MANYRSTICHFICIMAVAGIAPISAYAGNSSVTVATSVCFTPAQHCEPQIVEAIDAARSAIKLQAYGLTSLPIIHALQRAANRGVEVLAILDKVNERRYSGATLLEAAGIPVWIDSQPLPITRPS
ncbi:hypothetical protein [Rhizobium sp. HT1-10]|uniref:hypothetical protein n=1 Tax=Rhizobium sp. HT1-10 TaxID=3111638 RepID=UPI003C213156